MIQVFKNKVKNNIKVHEKHHKIHKARTEVITE